jgi:tRNA uridine 5-carbamoylmethylation protein Kti12
MPKHIVILTGPFSSGKRTACRQLADVARQRGLLHRDRVPGSL